MSVMLPHPGRSETEIEYTVGFDANGVISALDCKAWCLAGAFLDLAWNDLYGVMTGLDQVSLLNTLPHHQGWLVPYCMPACLCSRLVCVSTPLAFVLLLPATSMAASSLQHCVCIAVNDSVFV